WGWKTHFTITDLADSQVGDGDGLGRGGQVAFRGFQLNLPSGPVRLEYADRKERDLRVSAGNGAEGGRVPSGAHGFHGLVHPPYRLEGAGSVRGFIAETDAKHWSIRDAGDTEVGSIRDTTFVVLGRKRHATCRIALKLADENLRLMALAATAHFAVGRMRYY